MKKEEMVEKQRAILEEILELAKEAEQKLREMTGGLTALAKKWQQRAEDKITAAAQKQEV